MEFVSHQPALETTFDGDLVDAMTASLLAEDPDAMVAPYLMSGGTDAKRWDRLGIRCFGFTPLRLPADLDFTALFHGVDERVPVDALEFGARVLDRLLDRPELGGPVAMDDQLGGLPASSACTRPVRRTCSTSCARTAGTGWHRPCSLPGGRAGGARCSQCGTCSGAARGGAPGRPDQRAVERLTQAVEHDRDPRRHLAVRGVPQPGHPRTSQAR